MHYYYAYLWDKGTSAPFNRYVVATESVMTTNGQVFLAVLTESEEFAKRVISWFYEDALLILREHGVCRQIKSTFMQNLCREEKEGTVLLLYGKRNFSYVHGDINLFLDKKKYSAGYLICTDSFLKRMEKERILLKLSRETGLSKDPDLEDRLQRDLQEIKRRIRGRGEKDSIAAIYVLAERK